jgi:hypothetical protein
VEKNLNFLMDLMDSMGHMDHMDHHQKDKENIHMDFMGLMDHHQSLNVLNVEKNLNFQNSINQVLKI